MTLGAGPALAKAPEPSPNADALDGIVSFVIVRAAFTTSLASGVGERERDE
ncbi:MAG: hypothetical protein V4617_08000 [Gemmatimonadota bacterium]